MKNFIIQETRDSFFEIWRSIDNNAPLSISNMLRVKETTLPWGEVVKIAFIRSDFQNLGDFNHLRLVNLGKWPKSLCTRNGFSFLCKDNQSNEFLNSFDWLYQNIVEQYHYEYSVEYYEKWYSNKYSTYNEYLEYFRGSDTAKKFHLIIEWKKYFNF